MPEIAYIALGSNVGDRARHLTDAVALLDAAPGVRVTRVADPIETAPVNCPPGSASFLNSAAELTTDLGAEALLEVLLDIERRLGRQRPQHNAPRTIDLDLLLYGDRILDTPSLTLPHPRLHERGFVLRPMAQIAPDRVHPTLDKTIRTLCEDLLRSSPG